MKTIKIITAIFAVIAAATLVLQVLGVVDSESTKDVLLKVAIISGIAATLGVILQALSGSNK